MRLLHIHSGNLFGGVESVLRTLARARDLVPGFESVFALAYEGRIACELRACGCEVHILGEARASRPLSVFRARTKLATLRSRIGAEAAMAHSAWSLAILGPAAGHPMLLYLHDCFEGRSWVEKWSRRTPPDLVIANSHFTARSARRIRSRVPVTVIYPPVELAPARIAAAQRRSIRSQWGAGDNHTVILQASRFESWKGHLQHLRALSQLSNRSDWVLWIAGAPQRPEEVALQQEIERTALALGIHGRVHLLGHQSALGEIMQAADIYCQPNTGPEPFGLSFVEAMQAGLPVVTTDLGGACEIVNDCCGFRVAAADPDETAQALERLLLNPALRMRMGVAGSARALTLCHPQTQMGRIARAVDGLRANARSAA